MKIFTGYDPREKEGWHAFVQSLVSTSTEYVLMPPLYGKQHDGTNGFIYERFTIFERCHWAGRAIYLDGADMLLRAPIEELTALYDSNYAVQVVKHSYKTKHPRKYVGTEMEAENQDYERKNWSSLMLINIGHQAHWNARGRILDAIAKGDGKFLHRFGWLRDEQIGTLPLDWNWLADEYGENPNAKLLHWTAGMPGFKHYHDAPMSKHWHAAARTLHSER